MRKEEKIRKMETYRMLTLLNECLRATDWELNPEQIEYSLI